ncbi:MAG: hypothetical protein CBB77_09230 [Hyphomonas sp. TMED17]|nr:MAG: hypothetical protein CBB77_09230 [Hyphomonas sp. TMED17]
MRRFIRRIARLDAAPTEIRKATPAPYVPEAADSKPLGTSAIAPACAAVVSSECEEPRGADGDQESQAGPLRACRSATKKEAALIKIAPDQGGRGRGNLLPSYSLRTPGTRRSTAQRRNEG